ncbi:MAG: hypothetical protein JXX28_17050 [Deltaproteobacteria bacterium]|nr:hypothetical protein [Deltaproteobacteria bacterium]
MRYATILALALLVSDEALAANSMRLCVHHSLLNFVDLHGDLDQDGDVDDYDHVDDLLNDQTATLPAYGTKVKLTSPTGSVLFDDYVGDDDACTPNLPVTRGQPHQVRVYADARIDTNRIKVWNSSTTVDIWELDDVPWHAWAYPVHSQTYTWTPPTLPWLTTGRLTTTGEYAWNIAAIAGHALRRDSGGITDQTFRLLNNNTTCDGSAYSQRGRLTICGSHATKKYIIAHELGHALQAFARGETEELVVPSAHDYSMPLVNDACTSGMWGDEGGHRFNSREYQSAAMHEGFAHFYSALAFNYDDEADCDFRPYKDVDWDQGGTFSADPDLCCDGVPLGDSCGIWGLLKACYLPDWNTDPEYMDDKRRASCEGSPVVQFGYYAPYQDHLSFCSEKAWAGWYDQTPAGTPYDWMRFFWDLHTEQGGVSLAQILDIYGQAHGSNPEDHWVSSTPNADHTDEDYPAARLLEAAYLLGVGTQWQAIGDRNGIHTDPITGGN